MTRLRWHLQRIPSALLPNTEEAHALCILALAAAAGWVLAAVLMRIIDAVVG